VEPISWLFYLSFGSSYYILRVSDSSDWWRLLPLCYMILTSAIFLTLPTTQPPCGVTLVKSNYFYIRALQISDSGLGIIILKLQLILGVVFWGGANQTRNVALDCVDRNCTVQNLITDFTMLSNWTFLSINCDVWAALTGVLKSCAGRQRKSKVPHVARSPPVWHALSIRQLMNGMEYLYICCFSHLLFALW
jgi:hypothetical protein